MVLGTEAARQGSQALDDSGDNTDIWEGSEQGPGLLQIGLDLNKAAASSLLVAWHGGGLSCMDCLAKGSEKRKSEWRGQQE